jgi:lipopolysaccharide transport system ATP-binding protein
MSDLAIRALNLGKRFSIEKRIPRYATRELLEDAMRAPFRRFSFIVRQAMSNKNGEQPKNDKFIWALKDVSFEVRHGEVVGIIGPNGAGKSVLLKILSLVTKPTEGYVELYGKVGSMLEVGTGFHPELTGKENIYLSGAVLGMKKAEINRKFDEIVDFSEVEEFLDTPVKHYSSGMQGRLAFAVAVHLEPEILIMDEVLAVEDAAFVDKCLSKIKEVMNEGRTVLLVSHNMRTIESLCDRAMLLNKGKIVFSGYTHEAISQYLAQNHP